MQTVDQHFSSTQFFIEAIDRELLYLFDALQNEEETQIEQSKIRLQKMCYVLERQGQSFSTTSHYSMI